MSSAPPPLRARVPTPGALRFVGTASRPPKVPFGGVWRDDATAIAIWLDVPDGWPGSGLGEVGRITERIPRADSLPPGTLVVLVVEGPKSAGVLGRLLFARRPTIARAVRCSALLARGFTRLGGGIDPATGFDVAWGYSPGGETTP